MLCRYLFALERSFWLSSNCPSILSTGYGDISPNTFSAKLVTIIIILFGFALIPAQVAALLRVLYQRPKYAGYLSLPRNTQHICVCGIVDCELLYRLLTEIYHPTHAPATIGANIIVVVLSPVLPSKPVEALLRQSSFRNRMQFFVGISQSTYDLYRIKAEDSLAIYLLSDAVTKSLRNEEDAVFLSAISVSRYLDFKLSEKRFRSRELKQRGTKKCNLKFRGSLHVDGSVSRERTEIIQGGYARHTRPRTMIKLTSSARSRTVLAKCGIDIILSLQVSSLLCLWIGTFNSYL